MSKTETKGLDVRFKIGEKTYRIRSSNYDFILEEVKIRIEDSKSGKLKAGDEEFDHVAYGSTLDMIIQYLHKEHHLRNSDLSEVVDLVEELNKVIESVRDITTKIRVNTII